jgi:multiple sugar transport system permease protein
MSVDVNVNAAGSAMATPVSTVRREPERGGKGPGQWTVYALLVVLSGLFSIPFLWLVLTSLRPSEEIFAPGFWPSTITAENYADVFRYAPVFRWLLNSVIVSLLAVATVVASSSLVAYGFARLRFRGRKQLFGLVVATQLLPGVVTMVPTYLIWARLSDVVPEIAGTRLVNSWVPLFAGNLFGSAFYIFMLRQFLLSIPQELVEAARIDGASYFAIYRRIMLPLIAPALIWVAISEFMAKWNDFMGPLIYLNKPSLYTMALGLNSFKQENETQWELLMAASVVFTLPMIVLFFVFQRYFIEGVATTGSKT